MKIYKIKNIETGLFSKGGQNPKWSKKGKIWQGIGPLKNHFRLIEEKFWSYERNRNFNYKVEEVYKDCIIIEYDLENNISNVYQIKEIY